MLLDVKSFLLEKFWTPIINESVYYNPFNTTVYALLFGIAALYIVYPLSKKLDISYNRQFFISVAPYVFLGGSLRSLKDINIFDTILLETPFIYILVFFFTLGSFIACKKIAEPKQFDYHKLFGSLGLLVLILSLSAYSISNTAELIYFIVIMVLWCIPFYLGVRLVKPELLKYSFLVPVGAHYFDASTTVVSLMFGGAEKHVLARSFIEFFGLSGMFVMKTLAIIPIVYYVSENISDKDERNYYLFLITSLGLAIGTRNLLSLITI